MAVLARGPMAHLFSGVQEQNYIAHAMGYAACVGADVRHCQGEAMPPGDPANKSGAVQASAALLGSLLSLLLALTMLM